MGGMSNKDAGSASIDVFYFKTKKWERSKIREWNQITKFLDVKWRIFF